MKRTDTARKARPPRILMSKEEHDYLKGVAEKRGVTMDELFDAIIHGEDAFIKVLLVFNHKGRLGGIEGPCLPFFKRRRKTADV